MKKALLFLVMVLSLPALSQTKDAYRILNSLRDKYSAIKDYTVDASINVDIPFLKMPDKHAKIFYKSPDKVHIETNGFALVPKKAVNFDPASFIGSDFTAVYMKTEKWPDGEVDVVKTIPHDPDNDVILSTFWIDSGRKLIRKFEINSKTGGTYEVDFQYTNLPFDLPQRLTVNFDTKEMNLPKTATGELKIKDKNQDKGNSTKGKVTITYSNYKVNTGLDDSLFKEKKKAK